MTNGLYIPRHLLYKTETLTETELLSNDGVIVVLAEPGAGKSRLLGSIANHLGVTSQRASIFKSKSSVQSVNNLILDALDEVAKLDRSGIDLVLVKAQETGARKVILATRSSEWAEAQTVFLSECFSTEPMIVRLQALDEDAQKELFRNYVPGEDFAEFKNQVEAFALGSLLGNPQFLKLFADAYVEGGRTFKTKSRIFQDAVRRLAYEANKTISHKNGSVASLAKGRCVIRGLPVHLMILRWPDGPVAMPWPRSGRTVRDRRRARRSGPRRRCRPGGRTSRPGPCAARASPRSP